MKDVQMMDPIKAMIRKTIHKARKEQGMTWEDVAREANLIGWDITPGNLMTKSSRNMFRMTEGILLLHILKVDTLSTNIQIGRLTAQGNRNPEINDISVGSGTQKLQTHTPVTHEQIKDGTPVE